MFLIIFLLQALHCKLFFENPKVEMNSDCLKLFHDMTESESSIKFVIKRYDESHKIASVLLYPDNSTQSFNDIVEISYEEKFSRAEVIKKLIKDKHVAREYQVTCVVSPSEIYVRPSKLNQDFEAFKSHFNQAMRGQSARMKDISVGNIGAYRSGQSYYRCQLMSFDNSNNQTRVIVQHIDTGAKAEIETESLIDVPWTLLSKSAFCHCVYLADVKPLGKADGSWSATAIESIKEHLHRRSVLIKIEVKQYFFPCIT